MKNLRISLKKVFQTSQNGYSRLIAKHLKYKTNRLITNCLTIYKTSKTTVMDVGTNSTTS